MRRTRQNWAQRVRPKPQLRQTSREAQLGQAPNTKPTHHRPQTPPSPSGRPEKTQLRQAPNTKPSRGRIGRAEGAAGLVAYRPFTFGLCLKRPTFQPSTPLRLDPVYSGSPSFLSSWRTGWNWIATSAPRAVRPSQNTVLKNFFISTSILFA